MGIHKLKLRLVETVTEKGMYLDGGGLYLQVGEGGKSKSWIFRYHVEGRGDRQMGLGPLHTIGLAEARERARRCREQRKDDIDPIEARNAATLAQRLEAAKNVSFRTCTEEWFDRNKAGWDPSTQSNVESRLRVHLYPKFANLPISAINVDLVESAIKPIWETTPMVARKALEYLEGILNWATAKEYRSGDNPASLKGPLGIRLKPFASVHTITHNPGPPHQEIAAYIAGLRAVRNKRTGQRPITSYAQEFLILTAVRPHQATDLPWKGEIDWDNNLWVCPRHKTRKKTNNEPHVIPLSDAAMAILRAMREFQATKGITSDYVFAHGPQEAFGLAGKKVTRDGLTVFLRRTMHRHDINNHGFRETFKSWAIDFDWPDQDSERALGHVVGSAMSRLYGRNEKRLEPRRQLMEAWAEYCNRIEPLDAKIIPMPNKAARG